MSNATYEDLAQVLCRFNEAKIPETVSLRNQVKHHLKLLKRFPKKQSLLQRATNMYTAHCEMHMLKENFNPLPHLKHQLNYFANHKLANEVAVKHLIEKCLRSVKACEKLKQLLKRNNQIWFEVEEIILCSENRPELVRMLNKAKQEKINLYELLRKRKSILNKQYEHLRFIYHKEML